MKVTSVVVLSAIGFSLNVVADLASIEGVISKIESDVNAFDTAVKAYSGGSGYSDLESASQTIVTDTNTGVSTVKASADLSESDALSLTSPVQALTADIQTAIDDLIAKKSQIEAACQGPAVLASLQSQNTAAVALADAITSKVPSSLQSVASQLSAGISTAIQKGISAYQGATSCGKSSTSSGSSSTTSKSSGSTTLSTTLSTSSSSGPTTSSTPTVTSSGSSSGSPTGGHTTTTTPPAFTGAASINGFSTPVGVMAALAALLAF
jgi:hypothetical protein